MPDAITIPPISRPTARVEELEAGGSPPRPADCAPTTRLDGVLTARRVELVVCADRASRVAAPPFAEIDVVAPRGPVVGEPASGGVVVGGGIAPAGSVIAKSTWSDVAAAFVDETRTEQVPNTGTAPAPLGAPAPCATQLNWLCGLTPTNGRKR